MLAQLCTTPGWIQGGPPARRIVAATLLKWVWLRIAITSRANASISYCIACRIEDHVVVPEGFHTSLKPEEALIYLYDGCMVRMSYLGSVQAMGSVWCLLTACYLQRQPGYIGPS